jgi:hypothetical protein
MRAATQTAENTNNPTQMTEERQIETQAQARHLNRELQAAASRAQDAQRFTVGLAWDLGEVLKTEREARQGTFLAFLEGAGITDQTAKQCISLRNSVRKAELETPNGMRQALFYVLVPSKENVGGERIELAPPQDWRKWVNGARVWIRKLSVGLAQIDREAFKEETRSVYETLKELHEGR